MPNRILREGILTSPRMAKLGWPEEVFYRRLMSVVDDFGRYYADEGMLRAACYPRQLSKVSDSDIGKWTRVLAEAALVRVYPAEDGERYLELLDFRQQARAKASRFPPPRSACVADATQEPSKPPADAPVFVDVSVCVDGGVGERARKRAAQLPADWTLPDEWKAWAKRERGWDEAQSIRTSLLFRDHWHGTGQARADWEATWRNWVRRERAPTGATHDARMDVADQIFKRGRYAEPNAGERDITSVAKRLD